MVRAIASHANVFGTEARGAGASEHLGGVKREQRRTSMQAVFYKQFHTRLSG
jgi:hypothetical protein